MPEDKERRRKKIEDNFEKHLPSIWKRARENHEVLKAKFIEENNIGGNSRITFCVFCHSNEVLNQIIEFPILSKHKRFESIKLVGKKCCKCSVEYINAREVRAIECIIKIINEVIDDNEIEQDNTGKQVKINELMESAIGKKEFERQKELHQSRVLKPDYNESMLNLIECVICNGSDVPNKLLELDVAVEGILSVNVQGAECAQCGEQYYFSNDLKIVEVFKQIIKRNTQNN
ncbi:hypothetical protein J25TS5_20060 [Paenibacillus faecis]|uniref:hypothetical protein n=1 Tax=Paenibacillus faecis TaxID=862114 RepID=UPI001B26443A|nr:hypothetical protein [Paenibacillus faecis]GIO85074.1 hypothetical protein J25TS5_20060 [Paenibacillus faecis]